MYKRQAIGTLVKPGSRVVISGYEHNAVTRPLHAIEDVEIVVADAPLFAPEEMVRQFAAALETPADAVICTHVSNVFGYRLPVERIAELCRERGVPFVLDASQSAGMVPVDMTALGAAFAAMPGHKGLLGPQGTGLLVLGYGMNPEPLLLGGTGFIVYLPVPILTAIVISALLGATEFDLAIRLWKISRTECMIFVGAFIGVLFLGTINGVLIGILLSFAEVIIRTAKPARCFLGIQPGHRHFRDLKESSQIHAVSGVLIYRFSSNLFFANIQVLRQDIEDHVTPETKAVILDASGIGSIDITAADGLDILCKSLQKQNIRFYITEHIAGLNEQLRKLGLGYLIEEGHVRRTIHIALKDMGIGRPYPLEGGVDNTERSASRKRADNRVQEFVWAFGQDAESVIEKQIEKQIEQLKETGDVEALLHGRWAHMEELDEDEWLEHLEEHLKEIVNISGKDEQTLAEKIEAHRKEVHDRIAQEHPELAQKFRKRRHILDAHLKERRPEVYELITTLRRKREAGDSSGDRDIQ